MPVSTPPIEITVDAVTTFVVHPIMVGPFLVGTDYYVLLGSITSVAGRVYKSTDSGATWTFKSEATTPNGAYQNYAAEFSALKIDVAYPCAPGAPDTITQDTFTFSTDLFSLEVSASEPGINSDTMLTRLASGDLIACYSVLVTDHNVLYVRQFSGTWSGKVTIGATVSGESWSAGVSLVDGSDVTHLLSNFDPGTGIIEVRYQTVSSGPTGSGAIALPVTINDAGIFPLTGQPVVYAGKLIFPFIDKSSSFSRVAVAIAAGATANPSDASWSTASVRGGAMSTNWQDRSPFALIDSLGDLYVFWITEYSTDSILQIYSAKYNGATFDAPVLYYDVMALPPSGITTPQGMRVGSFRDIGGSILGVVTITDDAFTDHAFFLNGGGAAASGSYNLFF